MGDYPTYLLMLILLVFFVGAWLMLRARWRKEMPEAQRIMEESQRARWPTENDE